jgi:hypothetical protein
LTVSQNQSKNNLPVQGNDGVLFSKKVRERDFHLWACYSKNIVCVFCMGIRQFAEEFR